MKYTVIDIETDNLLKDLTKIYIIGYKEYNNLELIKSGIITDYNEMITYLKAQKIIVGHNFIRFDKPAIEKILNIKLEARIIDSLTLSWYLYPYGSNFKHGLEAWGQRLGFPKVSVDKEEWKNLDPELAKERVLGDVEINARLFHKQMSYLNQLYEGNFNPIIHYLMFKTECLAEQERIGITLNKRLCETEMHNLEFILDEKVDSLAKEMPRIVSKEAPKTMYKKDGTLSSHGKKWLLKLQELGLPETDTIITEPGNPGSNKQLKDWLLTLGWIPETFSVSKATGEEIPQVSLPHGAGICPSIQDLYVEHPYLENLEGLYIAKHRLGLFKSFLEAENKTKDGKIYSTAHGFTNTLRLQHSKPVVNLPGVDKYYGDKIRGALTVPDDSYTMIGSDVSGLEDRTKMHWMYFFDPEYVKQMQTPGFDGHTNIAVFAGMMSKNEEKFFKRITKEKEEAENKGEEYQFAPGDKGLYKHLAAIRKKAKPVNFGGQYGIGPEKLGKQLKIPLNEAMDLHTAYWNLNHSVKKVANSTTIKMVNNQKWQYNPLSGFWYFLKADKDRFSTLNQGKQHCSV